MKTLFAGIAALGVAALACANPLVIEETSILPLPPGVTALGGRVAIDGNEAVALSFYSYLDEGGYDYWTITSAHLYPPHRHDLDLVRKLAEGTTTAPTMRPTAIRSR